MPKVSKLYLYNQECSCYKCAKNAGGSAWLTRQTKKNHDAAQERRAFFTELGHAKIAKAKAETEEKRRQEAAAESRPDNDDSCAGESKLGRSDVEEEESDGDSERDGYDTWSDGVSEEWVVTQGGVLSDSEDFEWARQRDEEEARLDEQARLDDTSIADPQATRGTRVASTDLDTLDGGGGGAIAGGDPAPPALSDAERIDELETALKRSEIAHEKKMEKLLQLERLMDHLKAQDKARQDQLQTLQTEIVDMHHQLEKQGTLLRKCEQRGEQLARLFDRQSKTLTEAQRTCTEAKDSVNEVEEELARRKEAFELDPTHANGVTPARAPRALTPAAVVQPRFNKSLLREYTRATMRRLAPIIGNAKLPPRHPRSNSDFLCDDRADDNTWLPDFAGTYRDSVNKRFLNAVVDAMASGSGSCGFDYSTVDRASAYSAARTYFDTLRARFQRESVPGATEAKQDCARSRTVKRTKGNNRKAAYLDRRAQLAALEPTQRDADPLGPFYDISHLEAFKADLMSSEEEEREAEGGSSVKRRRVVRPSYRSRKLIKLYDTVDQLRPSTSRQKIPRWKGEGLDERVPPNDAKWWMISHRLFEDEDQPNVTEPISSVSPGDKYIGLALAISSSIAIGTSFIITKKGLISAADQSDGFSSDSYSYLKNGLWWAGMLTMVVGEVANFAAYTFAPPVLVTPLGALSVLIGAVLAAFFLGERLGPIGISGCSLCLVGSLIIVLHAPEDKEIATVDEILDYALQPGFMFYCLVVLCYSLYAIYRIAPKHGTSNPLVYISICSLVGSVSVMAVKGFGVALKLTFAGNNQLWRAGTWIFAVTVVGCIAVQMNYFNKALDLFPTTVVNPSYFVGFSSCTLLASIILFHGLNTTGGANTLSLLCGLFVICLGVYLLNLSRSENESSTNHRRLSHSTAGGGRTSHSYHLEGGSSAMRSSLSNGGGGGGRLSMQSDGGGGLGDDAAGRRSQNLYRSGGLIGAGVPADAGGPPLFDYHQGEDLHMQKFALREDSDEEEYSADERRGLRTSR